MEDAAGADHRAGLAGALGANQRLPLVHAGLTGGVAGLRTATGASKCSVTGAAFFLPHIRRYWQRRALIPTYGTQRCADVGEVVKQHLSSISAATVLFAC